MKEKKLDIKKKYVIEKGERKSEREKKQNKKKNTQVLITSINWHTYMQFWFVLYVSKIDLVSLMFAFEPLFAGKEKLDACQRHEFELWPMLFDHTTKKKSSIRILRKLKSFENYSISFKPFRVEVNRSNCQWMAVNILRLCFFISLFLTNSLAFLVYFVFNIAKHAPNPERFSFFSFFLFAYA